MNKTTDAERLKLLFTMVSFDVKWGKLINTSS